MNIQIRQIPDNVRYKGLTTEELRDGYLLSDFFKKGEINFNYIDLERAMVGAALPFTKPLELQSPDILRSEYFTERRELGIMNVGGEGTVEVDNVAYQLEYRDALYIGKGSKKIIFHSEKQDHPAKFYITSYPAHATFPTTHARLEDAEPLHLGSLEESNKRTIYKYIYKGGIESCQLLLGFTELEPGNVWNTMPPHKHIRRTEVYFYFNLDDDSVIFHLMGEEKETRHIVMKNEQAVFSPGWSIHAGSGTKNYSFIWTMGGENLDYTDMCQIQSSKVK
tara:strand:- start:325 stop:1161 length:837 start_codon:yes stop_codon:yes gene_type:complete